MVVSESEVVHCKDYEAHGRTELNRSGVIGILTALLVLFLLDNIVGAFN